MQLIDIGGRKLAVSCSGTGPETVILETGLGAESAEWAPIQQALEKHTRVLRYDRAGRGASEHALKPRDAAAMVEDLRTLLRLAEIPGPYVLVGHSFGGLLMRLFAHRCAADVKALVLVDSMHEDQFEILGPRFPPESPAEPPALRDVRTFWNERWRNPESTVEGIDFVSSIRAGRALDSLGTIPIRVLTAAGGWANQPLLPAEYRAPLQQLWDGLQRQFLKLSSDARHELVPNCGHFIQRDNPAAVIDAIRELLASPVSMAPGEVRTSPSSGDTRAAR